MLRLLSFLFLLIAFLGDVFSQDSHYWTEQYGTRSMLLSNSVVGSVEDLGAVYYNPARLSLIDNPSFMISAKVYQLNKTVFENPTGDKNAPIIKSDFGGVPSLVSGVFKISWLKNHRFAYAFLNRRSSDLNLSSGTETYGEVLANMPGNEHYSGEVALGKRFNEEWMGGSWSHAFKPNFSVGASGFFTTRNQSANMDTQLQALSEAGDVRSYLHRTGYNYTLNGLIFKVGAAWEVERLKLGVTVTSPMIILRGSGGFLHEVYYAGSGDVKPIYERNIQGGVKLKYHTPVSIALGGGVKLYKGLFQFSCEYYRRVGAYSLMQGTEFVGQSSGNNFV